MVAGATLLSLVALTLMVTMAAAPAGASLRPAAGQQSVPILGQVALKSNSETGRSAGVGTLHGVRRIPGGTVIYFSVGFPGSTSEASTSLLGFDHNSPAFSRSSPVTIFAKNMLVDPAGKKVYTSLIPAGDTSWAKGGSDCICSDQFGVRGASPGQARVMYQVVAPVPDSVQFVDVLISGQVIWNVKVDTGPMMPEVDPTKPILVGMGWPKVDQSVVASSVAPQASVVDLTHAVSPYDVRDPYEP